MQQLNVERFVFGMRIKWCARMCFMEWSHPDFSVAAFKQTGTSVRPQQQQTANDLHEYACMLITAYCKCNYLVKSNFSSNILMRSYFNKCLGLLVSKKTLNKY
eukprot:6251897-Amphidinium_carterae.1